MMTAQGRTNMSAAARPAKKEPAGRTAVRTKPVRITIDLTPLMHRDLTRWCAAAVERLDVPRVELTNAVRAAIVAFTTDPAMQSRVDEILRKSAGE
jgi:hypothetical protein